MPNQKFFNQALIHVNFYHHAKNQAILLICSRDMVYYKILLSDWLSNFGHYNRNKNFLKYGICAVYEFSL